MRTRGTRILCAAVLAVAAMAALPAAASAVDRYAAPDGDGASPCVIGDPCALEPAVEGASTGDAVILVGGAPPNPPFVQASTSVTVPGGVVVRGVTGAHQVVNFGPAIVGNSGFFLGATSVLRDLDIEYEGNGPAIDFSITGGSIERVFVHSVGANAYASCYITGPATIRDSVCWYDTDSIQGAGVEVRPLFGNFTVNIVNSTIISSSTEPGLMGRTLNGGATVNVTNSIVRSDTGVDVSGQVLSGPENLSVVLGSSNYATESDPGGLISITNPGTPTNQTTAPAFVSAAAGNFHQTASSTGTLNLGTPTALLPGELDLDGLARSQGSAPDIGAYEFPVSAGPPPGGNDPSTTPPAKKKCKKKAKKRSAASAKKKCKTKKGK